MSAWLKLVPSWTWWLLAVVLVAGVQQYRLITTQADLADTRAAWNEQLRLTAEANAAVILKQQADRLALEGRLADLDTQSTQELSDALAENDRLRTLYGAADDERRRLRIEVRVARADATVSATTGPGSLGDATSVELSAAAGSAVWDIRGGMISDRAKLEYLQEWARAVRAGE
ncbi:lysis system i-spanin subunit Rz [Stutzerimonas nitrititolerans]|uniref:lysis system i-spanin subunit Rz n=1 Tax=Stutzerimonas nitrititolerans TaxID=2482751 RepID=UPI00289ADAFA|nr:lysis system i-spanin subunit Rz [Stutzerimonas nitrititolerans]